MELETLEHQCAPQEDQMGSTGEIFKGDHLSQVVTLGQTVILRLQEILETTAHSVGKEITLLYQDALI